MRVWLPKTMSGLMATGCLLVAAPLLLSLLLAGAALERLTRHTELLVKNGLAAERMGAQLHENLTDLERSALQYIALGDPDLLDIFFTRVRRAEATLQRIELLNLAAPFPEGIQRVREGLAQATRDWTTGLQSASALNDAVDRIQNLGPESLAIIAAARAAIDAQVLALHEATALARRIMLWSVLALVPLAALLVLGFSLIVMRPLKQLRLGITDLGHGRYNQPIQIEYPGEMRRLGTQLDWLRRRLARFEADKDRFLRHVSHELKTPLASLHEGARLLNGGSLGPLTAPQREVTQILSDASVELAGQIENLLAFARWREGRRQPEMGWFEVRNLFKEALTAQKLPMIKRALRAELDLRTRCLFGQRSQLRIALDNLLANAVKHAPSGTAIEMRASVNGQNCELCIRDHGRGIPDAFKGMIFDPFVRGTEPEESAIRGTGVGLSIVKETILAHGGEVEVEDAHPGARFRLVWPCPQARPGA
jgi:two-component system, NtrC family, sensor histidine kinase GlrK